MRTIQMIGEFPVFGEVSASRAVSKLLKHLKQTTSNFELFFNHFQLTVQEWKVADVEHSDDTFFFEVEASVALPKREDIEDLQAFILQNEAELYFNETGFLPTKIN